MAVNTILVEDERRQTLRELVADPIVLDPLFRLAEDDDAFVCLRFVDPYGDTVFNRAQAGQLQKELQSLVMRASTPAQRSVLSALIALTVFTAEEPHRYLRFVGD